MMTNEQEIDQLRIELNEARVQLLYERRLRAELEQKLRVEQARFLPRDEWYPGDYYDESYG
jgi:hypothetical protein